jgi:hypothetical protein
MTWSFESYSTLLEGVERSIPFASLEGVRVLPLEGAERHLITAVVPLPLLN